MMTVSKFMLAWGWSARMRGNFVKDDIHIDTEFNKLIKDNIG
jgi:hypothetical protein